MQLTTLNTLATIHKFYFNIFFRKLVPGVIIIFEAFMDLQENDSRTLNALFTIASYRNKLFQTHFLSGVRCNCHQTTAIVPLADYQGHQMYRLVWWARC